MGKDSEEKRHDQDQESDPGQDTAANLAAVYVAYSGDDVVEQGGQPAAGGSVGFQGDVSLRLARSQTTSR